VSFAGDHMDRLVARGFFSPERAVLVTGMDDAILGPFRSLLARLQSEVAGFPHLVALVKTDLCAKEVAATAGFPSADNMARVFRRLEGVPPREYRRQHRQS